MPDNQQERLKFANWIVGFTDGEGCFTVSIFRNPTTKLGWQVFPEFVLTQGKKSFYVLRLIRIFFHCGIIRINRRHDNHREDLYRYCVRSLTELEKTIIPFFKRNPLRTNKKKDFYLFVRILSLMHQRKHLTKKGLQQIMELAGKMNMKKERKF